MTAAAPEIREVGFTEIDGAGRSRAADAGAAPPSQASSTYLLVPILLLFVLLTVAVIRSPSLISSAGIGSAVIVTTPLVLATYALMAVAIAGRGTVDLSVGPLIGFINVTLVQLFGLDLIASPLAVFAYVIVVGIAYQLIMGLIIVFVRVQPIIVALSGYLALSGINLVILARPGGTAPDWMSSWGLGTTIFSPMLAILVAATAAWLILGRTAFFGHLRMMGFDERAAYASGVRIGIVRLGAHCIAGIFSGLAALSYTALIGSGDPTQGTTYTLIAVTALVLGGTSLAGGRGGVIGSLLGAINLFLIGYVLATFNFGGIQGFVTDLCYGVILVLSLLLTVALPYVQRFTRHLSPFLVFMVLGLGLAAVMLHEKFDYGPAADQATAVTAGLAAARTSGSFVFEYPGPGIGGAMSQEQKMAALLAVLLISLVIFLRVMVSEAKTRRMTPLLYASLAIIVVVGTWLLAAR